MIGVSVILVLLGLPTEGMPQAVDTDVTKAISRTIKKAEMAQFERFDGTTYLRAFTNEAKWVYGRRAVPDTHDFIVGRNAYAARVRLNRWIKSDGQHRIYFRSFTFEQIHDEIVVEAEVALFFPGGNSVEQRRYRLKEVKGDWKINHLRSWPVRLVNSPFPIEYNDEFWLDADAEAATRLKDNQSDIKVRLHYLKRAYWFRTAYDLLKTETQTNPKDARVWALRAELAEMLGSIKDAQKSARQALKLDEKVQMSPVLRSMGRP